MGLDSEHCVSKQQNKWSKWKRNFWANYWSLCISDKPHSYSNY